MWSIYTLFCFQQNAQLTANTERSPCNKKLGTLISGLITTGAVDILHLREHTGIFSGFPIPLQCWALCLRTPHPPDTSMLALSKTSNPWPLHYSKILLEIFFVTTETDLVKAKCIQNLIVTRVKMLYAMKKNISWQPILHLETARKLSQKKKFILEILFAHLTDLINVFKYQKQLSILA